MATVSECRKYASSMVAWVVALKKMEREIPERLREGTCSVLIRARCTSQQVNIVE